MTLDRATSELLATVRVTGDELLDQVNASNGPRPDMAATADCAIAGVSAPVRVLIPTRRPRAVLIWYPRLVSGSHHYGCLPDNRLQARRANRLRGRSRWLCRGTCRPPRWSDRRVIGNPSLGRG